MDRKCWMCGQPSVVDEGSPLCGPHLQAAYSDSQALPKNYLTPRQRVRYVENNLEDEYSGVLDDVNDVETDET